MNNYLTPCRMKPMVVQTGYMTHDLERKWNYVIRPPAFIHSRLFSTQPIQSIGIHEVSSVVFITTEKMLKITKRQIFYMFYLQYQSIQLIGLLYRFVILNRERLIPGLCTPHGRKQIRFIALIENTIQLPYACLHRPIYDN